MNNCGGFLEVFLEKMMGASQNMAFIELKMVGAFYEMNLEENNGGGILKNFF